MLKLLLPIGLSFHTFQSLSYVIEVYKKRQKAEKHLGIYALYVMFYPQLVAGPIERPQHLLPQFYIRHKLSSANLTEGLRRIFLGLFKKIVIADRLALVVNQVYNSPQDYTGLPLLMATLAFAFQIYCDFSGYSDIAIGAARVMGFSLRENFSTPYFATSISDFWRRWHMSLYSWFLDYIYIPLGGNRVGSFLQARNILITFLLSGLWHGAAWTYVFWGFLHGLYVMFYSFIQSSKISFKHFFSKRIIATMTTFFLVCIAWIFFRAASIIDAYYILTHIFVNFDLVLRSLTRSDIQTLFLLSFGQGKGLGLPPHEFFIGVICVVFLLLYEWVYATGKNTKLPFTLRYMLYIVLVLTIINLGITKKIPFIYFQF